jgi:hypothetical protein
MEDNEKAEGLNPDANIDTKGGEVTPEEVNELKTNLKNVVEELKELRKKNKELADASIITPPDKEPEEDETTKIVKVFNELRKQEKEIEAKTNRQVAFEKFIAEHKEFHPDNDITGLKRQALEEKMNRFNTSDVTEIGDFYSVIEEASILLKKNDNSSNTSKEINNPYSSSSFPKVAPSVLKTSKLSAKEQKLVDSGQVTEERLLKLRETQPSFLRQLLERVND